MGGLTLEESLVPLLEFLLVKVGALDEVTQLFRGQLAVLLSHLFSFLFLKNNPKFKV